MVHLFSLFKGSVYCSLSAKPKPTSEVSTLFLTWPIFARSFWVTSVPRMDPRWVGDGDDCKGDSGRNFCFFIFNFHLEASGNRSLFLLRTGRIPNQALWLPESWSPLMVLIFKLSILPVTPFQGTSLQKELSCRYLVASSPFPLTLLLSWKLRAFRNGCSFDSHKPVVLNWRQFWPWDTLDNIWRYLGLFQRGEVYYWHPGGRGQVPGMLLNAIQGPGQPHDRKLSGPIRRFRIPGVTPHSLSVIPTFAACSAVSLALLSPLPIQQIPNISSSLTPFNLPHWLTFLFR